MGLAISVRGVLNVADSNGYKELNKICINDSEMIISENTNPEAQYRYMVIENRYTTYYNKSGNNNIYTGHTNDYLKAIDIFTEKVRNNIDCVTSRREVNQSLYGIEPITLTTESCISDSINVIYTGRLLIVKAEELKPEYRNAENQLMVCSHGNGARPNAIGTSVFGTELLSGENVCYGRHQIAGIADPKKMPDWAVEKMAVIESQRELQKKAQTAPKPSLHDKLETAKETARKAGDKGDKPKKRKDMEVT